MLAHGDRDGTTGTGPQFCGRSYPAITRTLRPHHTAVCHAPNWSLQSVIQCMHPGARTLQHGEVDRMVGTSLQESEPQPISRSVCALVMARSKSTAGCVWYHPGEAEAETKRNITEQNGTNSTGWTPPKLCGTLPPSNTHMPRSRNSRHDNKRTSRSQQESSVCATHDS